MVNTFGLGGLQSLLKLFHSVFLAHYRQHAEEYMLLRSNKTLFSKRVHGLESACEPWFSILCHGDPFMLPLASAGALGLGAELQMVTVVT